MRALTLALLLLAPTTLCGQVADTARSDFVPYAPPRLRAEPERPEPVMPPVLGGLGGGLVGIALGVAGGVMVSEGSSCYDIECIIFPVAGALLGETIGIPLGVHEASRGQADLNRALATSFGIAGAGLLTALLVPEAGLGILFIAVPLGQLGTSMATLP